MLICQISDLHIKAHGQRSYRVVDTTQALRECLASIQALPQAPDVVVATGDLVDFGRAEEYRALAELLAPLNQPIYLLPGNHDERNALCSSFPLHTYLQTGTERLNYVIDDYPVRLVAIDTVVAGAAGGIVDASTLKWLDETLGAAPDRPTLVMMHHPPFDTGIAHMDEIGLEGKTAVAAVIGRHPHVERIICGHLHRAISTRFAGTIASTCPSPAHQVMLDLSPDGPSRFMMEPPGYQLHLWRPGAGLVTHSVAIGEFAGPYPFSDDHGLID
ncbi:MAG: phosphodiesterase [Burkholderiaceae bacterium]|jgi:3',5'-cyclic AMP phosphodiesterase CpdA